MTEEEAFTIASKRWPRYEVTRAMKREDGRWDLRLACGHEHVCTDRREGPKIGRPTVVACYDCALKN